MPLRLSAGSFDICNVWDAPFAFVWGRSTGPYETICKNGFLRDLGFEDRAGGNNTIPYRQDLIRDDAAFLRYVADDWIGRGWVDVSDALKDAIGSAVLEIYINAFEA